MASFHAPIAARPTLIIVPLHAIEGGVIMSQSRSHQVYSTSGGRLSDNRHAFYQGLFDKCDAKYASQRAVLESKYSEELAKASDNEEKALIRNYHNIELHRLHVRALAERRDIQEAKMAEMGAPPKHRAYRTHTNASHQ